MWALIGHGDVWGLGSHWEGLGASGGKAHVMVGSCLNFDGAGRVKDGVCLKAVTAFGGGGIAAVWDWHEVALFLAPRVGAALLGSCVV